MCVKVAIIKEKQGKMNGNLVVAVCCGRCETKLFQWLAVVHVSLRDWSTDETPVEIE